VAAKKKTKGKKTSKKKKKYEKIESQDIISVRGYTLSYSSPKEGRALGATYYTFLVARMPIPRRRN